MINDRLQQLEGDNALSISSHRLQEKLLKHFPNLRSHTDQPKPTILAFEENVATIVRDATYQEAHDHFIELARTATTCRAEMFNIGETSFKGSLSYPRCARHSAISADTNQNAFSRTKHQRSE